MNTSWLKELPNFATASVLVFGDVILDKYLCGETCRISPEAPVPIVQIKNTINRPGGAANVALNLAALGVKVTLIGVIGNDPEGAWLRDTLLKSGVNCDFYVCDQQPTVTKQRVISHHQQLMRLDIEETWRNFDQATLLQMFTKYLMAVNVVILSDYGKGSLCAPQQLINLARAKNIHVLVDPKGKDFSIYANANLITPNLHEFTAVVGNCVTEPEIVHRGLELIKHLNLGAIIVTRGEQGMTLITETQDHYHLPAYNTHEVYDVTGAGDTVIAFLGAALAVNLPIMQAMILANLAASIVVTKLGTSTVTLDELNTVITTDQEKITVLPPAGVVTEPQLLDLRQKLRILGKKLVFTNGCFDIIHAGHIAYLKQAKALGDYLVVAINSDDIVAKLKGPKRPINNIHYRSMVLAALMMVDWVIVFYEETPEQLIDKLQPDFLVKGGDYTIDQIAGSETVKQYGGQVQVLKFINDLSTTCVVAHEQFHDVVHSQD